jgi:GNAT superfamily N-acetyltransferase
MTLTQTSPISAIKTDVKKPKTGDVQYRLALPGDIPAMTDIFLKAVSDLYTRYNVSAAVPPRPAVLAAYEHVRSTGIFRVAELDGEIIAIAGAILRGNVWYLSSFWAHPKRQRKGIGMPLLRQVWNAGIEAGVTRFFTWSSIDSTAMAAYMKLGLLPGSQIMQFEGMPSRLPAKPAGYQVMDLERPVALALDEEIPGLYRPADHDFWVNQAGLLGRQVVLKGQIAGYYYLGRGGIGPATWRKPEDAEPIMTLAFAEAMESAPAIKLAIPGMNHAALRYVLDAGLRLNSFAHLLTSRPFEHLDRYLPSGPGLF